MCLWGAERINIFQNATETEILVLRRTGVKVRRLWWVQGSLAACLVRERGFSFLLLYTQSIIHRIQSKEPADSALPLHHSLGQYSFNQFTRNYYWKLGQSIWILPAHLLAQYTSHWVYTSFQGAVGLCTGGRITVRPHSHSRKPRGCLVPKSAWIPSRNISHYI